MTLRGLYEYAGSLTHPVRYRSKTVLYAPTVGADSIRPKPCATELSGGWKQVPVTILGFPRGKPRSERFTLLPFIERLCSVSLRADAIRPYK